MTLAEKRIDVQARIAEQDRAAGDRIATGVIEQTGRKYPAHHRRTFEQLSNRERAVEVAAEIGSEAGAKGLHLGCVEGGGRDGESVFASANQVACAGCGLEFRDQF